MLKREGEAEYYFMSNDNMFSIYSESFSSIHNNVPIFQMKELRLKRSLPPKVLTTNNTTLRLMASMYIVPYPVLFSTTPIRSIIKILTISNDSNLLPAKLSLRYLNFM